MTQAAPKITAVVIVYNDAPYIRSCLESLIWADELIVVDSNSTDGTTAICHEFTDNVFHHEFSGFGRLRNEAIVHASHDWIFSLDSDERATPEIVEEMRAILLRTIDADAFFVPRRNYFLGHWVKYCGWYPDYRQPQFFNKNAMRYREDLVHETYELDGRIGYLREHVDQYPFRNIDHYLQKMDRYSTLMAEQMVKQGRHFHPHQLVTHPLFTFFKMFILRRGILGGKPELILSGLYAYYTFVKYAKFWELTKKTLSKPVS